MDKSIMSDPSTVQEIFSRLDVTHILFFVERFKRDELYPEEVPASVKEALKKLCAGKQNHLEMDVNAVDQLEWNQ
jgi:hypothetical protein